MKFTNMPNSPANQPEQKVKPIWEYFEDIASKLPTDGAAQLDHYLYGKPKSGLSTCN
jgi:hypothetical protein